MARDDPTPQQRIVPISIKLRCDNHDELKEQHGADLSRGFFFVRTRQPKPVGTLLRFGLQLSHGETVLRGVGRVAMVVEPEESRDKPGMMLQLRALDATSQLVMKALGWDLRLPTTRAGAVPAPPPVARAERGVRNEDITARSRMPEPPRRKPVAPPPVEEDVVAEEDDRRVQTMPGLPPARPPPPPEDDEDEIEAEDTSPPPGPVEDKSIEPEPEQEQQPEPEPEQQQPEAEQAPEPEPEPEPQPEPEPDPEPVVQPAPDALHLSSRTIVVMNPLSSIFQQPPRGILAGEREFGEDDFSERAGAPPSVEVSPEIESTIEPSLTDELRQEQREQEHTNEHPEERELDLAADAPPEGELELDGEASHERDDFLIPEGYQPPLLEAEPEGEAPQEPVEAEQQPAAPEADDGRYPTLFMEETPQFQPEPARFNEAREVPQEQEVTRILDLNTVHIAPDLVAEKPEEEVEVEEEQVIEPEPEEEIVAAAPPPPPPPEPDPEPEAEIEPEPEPVAEEEPPSPPSITRRHRDEGPRTIPPQAKAETVMDIVHPPPPVAEPEEEAPVVRRGRRSIAPMKKPLELERPPPPPRDETPPPVEVEAPVVRRGRRSISPSRKPEELERQIASSRDETPPPVSIVPPAEEEAPVVRRGKRSIAPMRKPEGLVSVPPVQEPPKETPPPTPEPEGPASNAPTPIGRFRDKKKRAREEAPPPAAEEQQAPAAQAAEGGEQVAPPVEAGTGGIIAIDFGTGNTMIARYRSGSPELVPSPDGDFSLPSLFAIDKKGRELVGREARGELLQHSKNAIFASARFLGRPFQSASVRELHKQVPYALVEAVDGDSEIETGGKPMTIRNVASKILGEAMVWARKQSRTEVKRAIFTVPACYTANQRRALREAAETAGFTVERLLTKTAAASVFYGHERQTRQKILVYRLGGGSFDVAVVEIKNGRNHTVLGSAGESALGGLDFDLRLEEILLQRLETEHNRSFGLNPVIVRALIEAAEAAKIALSERDLYNVGIPFLPLSHTEMVDFDTSLTRADLERVTGDLVDRTIELTTELLATLKIKPGEIGDYVVVGGQSRMPMVRTKLKQLFGKEPAKGVNPEEAIALGAAILADAIDKPGDQQITVTEALPSSIGVALPGGKFKKVLEAGTAIPTSASHALATTKDNQTEIELFVFQGESERALDNHFLGWARLDGIGRAPKGTNKAGLDLRVSADGTLSVARRDRPSDAEKPVGISFKISQKELRDKVGEGPAPAGPERRGVFRRTGRG